MKHILKSVTVIKDINMTTSLLKVKLSSNINKEYYTFMNISEAQLLLNEEIEFKCRTEIIDGEEQEVITDLAIKKVVQTLSADNHIKLYTEDSRLNKSNVRFSELPVGEVIYGAEVYCISSSFGRSSRAEWCLMRVMDSTGKTVDVYNFEERGKEGEDLYGGHYINCNITRTERGYTTTSVMYKERAEMEINADIVIAIRYLERMIEDDAELTEFVNGTDFLNSLANYSHPDEIERGYIAVNLAGEVMLASIMDDITMVVDRKIIIRGLFARKAYILTNKPESTRSLSLQSILNCVKYSFGKDTRIQNILEDNPQKVIVEKEVINKITDLVSLVVSARRRITTLLLANDPIWSSVAKKR